MQTLSLSNVVEAMFDCIDRILTTANHVIRHSSQDRTKENTIADCLPSTHCPTVLFEHCRILVQIRSIKGVLTYNIYELYLEAARAGAGRA